VPELIQVEDCDGIAVVRVANPPADALSASLCAELLDFFVAMGCEGRFRGVVLAGCDATFNGAADVRESTGPMLDPQLPHLVEAIERCPQPVVAAIEGTTLTVGLELALACDVRIAGQGATMGLPEVHLGIIPGAGGAQRLPRLVGVPAALDLICTGRKISADEALRLGLVCQIASSPVGTAIAMLRAGIAAKQLVRHLQVPESTDAALDAALAKTRKLWSTLPHIQDAVQAVLSAARTPFDPAALRDRATFARLRSAPHAVALRHLFFAERAAGRHADLPELHGDDVALLGVLGAGTMGRGITSCAMEAGLKVTLVDRDPAVLAAATRALQVHFERRVAVGRCTQAQADSAFDRLRTAQDIAELASVDLVVEAVFEDLEVKRDVLVKLDRVMRPGAVIASNTSYLDVDVLAAASRRQADMVGMHFFSPVPAMKLVEVVSGRHTSPRTLSVVTGLARRLGKLPVLTRNGFGFIGNRVFSAYRRQCEFMLEEGALPHEVDAALEGMGMAMGPFAVADLSGLDIAWRMRQALAHARDPSHRYVDIPDRLCELGRLGRKAGRGYYGYGADGAKWVDPCVQVLIEEASARKGVARRALPAHEIVERAWSAMANEAAHLVGEGVAFRRDDVDVVLANGYGFPRHLGGPVHWARTLGRPRMETLLDDLESASGAGFARADLSLLLDATS
jgi:3-hydroxyacyl-CoA dehydrogenase